MAKKRYKAEEIIHKLLVDGILSTNLTFPKGLQTVG
jgi:hypothetical protein